MKLRMNTTEALRTPRNIMSVLAAPLLVITGTVYNSTALQGALPAIIVYPVAVAYVLLLTFYTTIFVLSLAASTNTSFWVARHYTPAKIWPNKWIYPNILPLCPFLWLSERDDAIVQAAECAVNTEV